MGICSGQNLGFDFDLGIDAKLYLNAGNARMFGMCRSALRRIRPTDDPPKQDENEYSDPERRDRDV